MPRSTGTVFVVAFVLGVVAFIGTLLFAPVPKGEQGSISPEEQVAQEAAYTAGRRHQNTRAQRIIAGDWAGLAATARASLEHNPTDFWAHADLLNALANGAGDADELTAAAERTLEDLGAMPEPGRGRWGVQWATGWAKWSLGDHEAARATWREAAEGMQLAQERGERVESYNIAAQLALAGEHDAAIEAWERAVRAEGYREYAFARADCDLRDLRDDPRFEAVIAEAQRQREAWRRARDDEAAAFVGPPEPGPDGPGPGEGG